MCTLPPSAKEGPVPVSINGIPDMTRPNEAIYFTYKDGLKLNVNLVTPCRCRPQASRIGASANWVETYR